MSKTRRRSLKLTVLGVTANVSARRAKEAPKKPVYVFKGRFQ